MLFLLGIFFSCGFSAALYMAGIGLWVSVLDLVIPFCIVIVLGIFSFGSYSFVLFIFRSTMDLCSFGYGQYGSIGAALVDATCTYIA